jgi:hypothetical protein
MTCPIAASRPFRQPLSAFGFDGFDIQRRPFAAIQRINSFGDFQLQLFKS